MIKVDAGKCTGCKMCETACSFFHTGSTNRNKSRINVVQLYEKGIDAPVVCVQCKERYCTDCREHALTIGEFGQVIVSPTSCTLCNRCVKSCPIGAIHRFEDFIYVCDLCGGNPRCVEACTEGAISFLPDKKESVSLKSYKEKGKGKNVSEKRAAFVDRAGKNLRKKWRAHHA